MTVWHTKDETPKEGAKIEYIISSKVVDVGVWIDGELDYRPDDWNYAKMWRYIDENYMSGIGE
jgi:hypothetical protein